MVESGRISVTAKSPESSDLSFWRGKNVFVTGHTGFKGSWLSLMLSSLGANVHGYSLQPPTVPSLFEQAKVQAAVTSSVLGDIRDRPHISKALESAAPEILFHLAAQPMVLDSYEEPFETYDVNVSGTVSVLDAARRVPSIKAIIVVTTDKCYENIVKRTHSVVMIPTALRRAVQRSSQRRIEDLFSQVPIATVKHPKSGLRRREPET